MYNYVMALLIINLKKSRYLNKKKQQHSVSGSA